MLKKFFDDAVVVMTESVRANNSPSRSSFLRSLGSDRGFIPIANPCFMRRMRAV